MASSSTIAPTIAPPVEGPPLEEILYHVRLIDPWRVSQATAGSPQAQYTFFGLQLELHGHARLDNQPVQLTLDFSTASRASQRKQLCNVLGPYQLIVAAKMLSEAATDQQKPLLQAMVPVQTQNALARINTIHFLKYCNTGEDVYRELERVLDHVSVARPCELTFLRHNHAQASAKIRPFAARADVQRAQVAQFQKLEAEESKWPEERKKRKQFVLQQMDFFREEYLYHHISAQLLDLHREIMADGGQWHAYEFEKALWYYHAPSNSLFAEHPMRNDERTRQLIGSVQLRTRVAAQRLQHGVRRFLRVKHTVDRSVETLLAVISGKVVDVLVEEGLDEWMRRTEEEERAAVERMWQLELTKLEEAKRLEELELAKLVEAKRVAESELATVAEATRVEELALEKHRVALVEVKRQEEEMEVNRVRLEAETKRLEELAAMKKLEIEEAEKARIRQVEEAQRLEELEKKRRAEETVKAQRLAKEACRWRELAAAQKKLTQEEEEAQKLQAQKEEEEEAERQELLAAVKETQVVMEEKAEIQPPRAGLVEIGILTSESVPVLISEESELVGVPSKPLAETARPSQAPQPQMEPATACIGQDCDSDDDGVARNWRSRLRLLKTNYEKKRTSPKKPRPRPEKRGPVRLIVSEGVISPLEPDLRDRSSLLLELAVDGPTPVLFASLKQARSVPSPRVSAPIALPWRRDGSFRRFHAFFTGSEPHAKLPSAYTTISTRSSTSPRPLTPPTMPAIVNTSSSYSKPPPPTQLATESWDVPRKHAPTNSSTKKLPYIRKKHAQ